MSLYRSQLIFCCRTAGNDSSGIPTLVIQADDVIAIRFGFAFNVINRRLRSYNNRSRIAILISLRVAFLIYFTANRQAAVRTKVDVFVQFYLQFSAAGGIAFLIHCRRSNHTDITFGQTVFGLSLAFDVNQVVQFYCNRIVLIVAEVTAVLHAVVQGSYFVVVHDQTGNTILPIYTVYARFTIAGYGDGLDFSVFTLHTDRARCTGFARFTVLTVNDQGIEFRIFIHHNRNGCGSVFCLFNGSCQIISTVFMVFFRINTNDVNGGIQFVGYRVVAFFFFRSVSAKFQAVVQSSYFMVARFIFVDDAGHTVFAVQTRFTAGAYLDVYSIGAVLTVGTIPAVDADGTVFAVLSVYYYSINVQISVQGCFNGSNAIFIFRYRSNNVTCFFNFCITLFIKHHITVVIRFINSIADDVQLHIVNPGYLIICGYNMGNRIFLRICRIVCTIIVISSTSSLCDSSSQLCNVNNVGI